MVRATIFSLMLAMAVVPVVRGQDGPRVVKMTVSPSPRSDVPIPYPLLPHLRDITPGNAALYYVRSQTYGMWSYRRKDIMAANEALEEPWAADNVKKFQWLESYGALAEADLGARSDACDWQILERIRRDGIAATIDELQPVRTIAALNAVRVRSAIHQGDFEKAARGLQTGFAMARHVGDNPSLIAFLIGHAIEGLTANNLEEWVQQPDAPSLYWALADLPQPLIDWRRAFQGDAIMTEQSMPEIRRSLQEKKPTPIPLETLPKYVDKFWQLVGDRGDTSIAAFVFALAEPDARAYFLKMGLAAEDIERLPVTQLALMYFLAQYDLRSAERLSVQNLPYWQARPFLKKWREEETARQRGSFLEQLQNRWTPAFDTIFAARPRIERRLALLRHVEALRLFAANHQGAWPDSLDDIRDLPLPADPFTGKAFTYRRENKTAILEAPPPPGMPLTEWNSTRYELTLRAQGK